MTSMLFYKNGSFSKTSVLLILSFVLVAVRYFLGGIDIAGIHVSEFNPASALAFFGTVAVLYFSNHNIQLRVGGNTYNPPSEKRPISLSQLEKEPK